MKRPYTAKDTQTIRDGVANGESFGAIAKRLGRTRNAVAGQANRLGIKANVKTLVWTPEKVKEASAMMATHSYAAIGKHFGTGKNAVGLMAKRYGLKSDFKKGDDMSAAETQYLLDNYSTKSLRDIGAHLGRAGTTIGRKLKAMGLSQPRSRPRTVTTFAKPRAAKVEPVEVIPDTARPWLSRLRNECSYPYGERGNIHSCCAPVWRGTGLCETHAALCGGYQKVAA